MYQPFVLKLKSGKSDVLDKGVNKDNLILSSTINLPLISLGFHAFIHRTKSAMSITKNIQTKNKFYYVVNPFEHVISDYEDSLDNLTKIYFGIKKDNPEILSRSFYKLWEILYLFDIADKKDLSYVSIAEGPSTFIQALINYRQKIGHGITNDKIFGVTIHPEKEKQFISFYNKQVPGLLNYNTTTDSGDITQVKTIGLLKKDIEKTKEYCDLVTADSEIKWDDTNFKEQEGYQLILGEIITALRVQAKNGHFVIKIFETFTLTSIKLIYILSSFYEETYIYKPFFSRESNSEKYVICKGFKYDQKKDTTLLDKKIKTLEAILEGMNTNKYIFDIFPGLDIPSDYIDSFKFINTKITNSEQIMINDIVSYIKENNYFGEKYHIYKEKQIDATKWWISNFYPPSNNLHVQNKEELQKWLNTCLEKYHVEKNNFSSTFVK
jgi:23S rRNA U2552 (ribose-2'-O)-methylase RlmE/FtsJ